MNGEGIVCACASGIGAFRHRRMRRGDDAPFRLQVVQDARTGEYGSIWAGEPMPPGCAPVDLTGWRVIFTAKLAYAEWDTTAATQLDNQAIGGVSLVSPAAGWAQATVPRLATMGFPDGPVRLLYDFQGVDAGGLTHTLEVGRLEVLPHATRAPY